MELDKYGNTYNSSLFGTYVRALPQSKDEEKIHKQLVDKNIELYELYNTDSGMLKAVFKPPFGSVKSKVYKNLTSLMKEVCNG